MADVADQPGALPLLQYALTELFERREGRMLTNKAYQDIGGVLGALGRRAEEEYRDLDQSGRQDARQLFLRLVTLGEGTEDTRRQVQSSELQSLFRDGLALINQVIDVFGKARLLSFDRDPVTRGPTVEVAHEALLGEWRRLREWLDQSRADIRMQRVLGNAANEWLESGREASYLLRGSRLNQFEAWEETSDMALTQVERNYLAASLEERRDREAAEAERLTREAATERRSRNFLRALVGVFAVAAIVAVGLTIFAFNQPGIAQSEADQRATAEAIALEERQEAILQADGRATQQAIAETEAKARGIAEEQALEDRDRAVEAQQDALEQREEALHQAAIGLASQAELQAKGGAPETAILLALEALENYSYTWQAEKALGNAILNSRLRMVIPFDDTFQGVEWSSDSSKILVSGIERDVEGQKINANARVLDASTGEELIRITEGEPNMANWSPDEKSILALNEDEVIVQVWDADSGTARLTLDMEDIGGGLNTSPADWESWSPSGDRFLVHNTNGLVKIFDAITGEALQTLSGHEGVLLESQWRRVDQAMWSPKSDLVAVISSVDNNVIVYQADTGEALYTIPSGSEDSEIRLGSWSPSGDRFITRGLGGANVYEAATGRQLLDLSIPQTFCVRALWSPDGLKILTIDNVESATVWDAESGQELVRIKDVVFVLQGDLSPSGDIAAIADADGFVNLWDVVTGQVVHKLPGTFGYATWVQFSPDGEQILAFGDDNTINILDLTEASLSIPISTCYGISNPTWSPDDQQVAFNSYCPPDYPVKIWDANSGEELFELPTQNDASEFLWSPSGDRILTSFSGGRFMIWDAHNFDLLFTFTGQEGEVWVSEWSPDGSQIATSYTNGTVVVWDSSNGEEILTFTGHAGEHVIESISWSPEGTQLLSTSEQGEAIIWDAATGEVLLELFAEDFKLAVPDSAWAKDGEWVILFSADGFVRIFDPRTGEQISKFFTRSGSSITHFSLSPTEERMIIGGGDNLATVWDIATGTEILNYEVGGYVWPTYSPDGSQVAVGNSEGKWGRLQVFPVWDSLEELVDYAKECCVVRELTPGEREVFGLPPR